MRGKTVGFIPHAEESYILLLLGHIEPDGKERGLERLCAYYQRGYRLRDPHPFHQAFIACLYQQVGSVRRWALNAVAVAGARAVHLQAVLDAIERDRADDDIFAAGIGALVALTRDDEREALLSKANVELEGVALLAAAQQADSFKGKLAKQRVNIETASAPELRLAAVLLGLDKAPEHLFDLGHDNSAVIGRLDTHPDALVAQYAVWSICEHPALNLRHMSSSIRDIEGPPERVRGYTYRLMTQDDQLAEVHREYILLGSEDPSAKARGGLAGGLAKAFYDGLEQTTLDWFDSEPDQGIKGELLDHIVLFSHRSPIYTAKAVDEYDAAGLGSLSRARMRAAAEGRPLYGEFRKRDLIGESGLLFAGSALPFFGGNTLTTINATTVNAGLIGDNANVKGGVNVVQTNYVERAATALMELRQLLVEAGDDKIVQEGRDLVAVAQASPTKGSVGKVLSWMKDAAETTANTLASVEGFHKIYNALGSVVDNLSL